MLTVTRAVVEEVPSVSMLGFAFFRTDYNLPEQTFAEQTFVSPVLSGIELHEIGMTVRYP